MQSQPVRNLLLLFGLLLLQKGLQLVDLLAVQELGMDECLSQEPIARGDVSFNDLLEVVEGLV